MDDIKRVEYRILLPLELAEGRIGQLYTVAERMKVETSGNEGYKIVRNEAVKGPIKTDYPWTQRLGAIPLQYSYKIIQLKKKAPVSIQALSPTGSLEVHEESWNAYPTVVATRYSNTYMKTNFVLNFESKFVADDEGTQENIFELTEDQLKSRKVITIDIANSIMFPNDYDPNMDPTKFTSAKTGRGPLVGDWQKDCKPVMCIYKLLSLKFKWFGQQTKIENIIKETIYRILLTFHREMFCSIDHWHGMTIEDIRDLEKKTKKDLDELLLTGEPRGMFA